jgi:hypothetical protein
MSEFISGYKNAFNRHSTMGISQWIYFTIKSALLFLLLLFVFCLLQFVVLIYSPLKEYATVPGIKQSNIYGLVIMSAVSFLSSVIHLVKMMIRKA